MPPRSGAARSQLARSRCDSSEASPATCIFPREPKHERSPSGDKAESSCRPFSFIQEQSRSQISLAERRETIRRKLCPPRSIDPASGEPGLVPSPQRYCCLACAEKGRMRREACGCDSAEEQICDPEIARNLARAEWYRGRFRGLEDACGRRRSQSLAANAAHIRWLPSVSVWTRRLEIAATQSAAPAWCWSKWRPLTRRWSRVWRGFVANLRVRVSRRSMPSTDAASIHKVCAPFN